jgi:hypothetical protein
LIDVNEWVAGACTFSVTDRRLFVPYHSGRSEVEIKRTVRRVVMDKSLTIPPDEQTSHGRSTTVILPVFTVFTILTILTTLIVI